MRDKTQTFNLKMSEILEEITQDCGLEIANSRPRGKTVSFSTNSKNVTVSLNEEKIDNIFKAERLEILKRYQNGELSEEEILNALGNMRESKLTSSQQDDCPSNFEFDLQIHNFAFYTRRQGRINVYFSFTPMKPSEWATKIMQNGPSEENEKYSGTIYSGVLVSNL